jgi:hypothetical protein
MRTLLSYYAAAIHRPGKAGAAFHRRAIPVPCTWPPPSARRSSASTAPPTRRATARLRPMTLPFRTAARSTTHAVGKILRIFLGFPSRRLWPPRKYDWRGRMDSAYAAWATRWRVPLGFLLGVAYLVFCRPTVKLLIAGGAVAAAGVAIRAFAAGHLAKNQKLAMSGPYACTRNPLYLGSSLMGAGFALAGGWQLDSGTGLHDFVRRPSIGRSFAARKNTCAGSSGRFTIVTLNVFPFSSRAFAGPRAARSFSGSSTGKIMSTKLYWATLP